MNKQIPERGTPSLRRPRWQGLVLWGLLAAVALALAVWQALQWRQQARRDAWLRAELAQLEAPARLEAGLIRCDTDAGRPLLRLLVLGQSNAGNHGPKVIPSAELPRIQLQGELQCHLAQDPLPGASGEGRSIWSVLPAALHRQGLMREPQIALLAVQSTTITDWSRSSSPLNQALLHKLQVLQAAAWVPDLVLWQQGEADAMAGTSANDYAQAWQQLLAQLQGAGLRAPVLLARSTHCQFQASPNSSSSDRAGSQGGGAAAIRSALQDLSTRHRQLRPGPDTDTLTDASLRRDGCHFSLLGLEAAAQLWSASIAEALAQTPASH